MNRKQFLLTKKSIDDADLKQVDKIGDYNLYLGPDSDYCRIKKGDYEYHMLGHMYDWKNVSFSNYDILLHISNRDDISDVLSATDNYCGDFVLIAKLKNRIYVFNDATGRKEVYYDDEFTCLGTQPKILGKVIELKDHTDVDAKEYYKSDIFLKKNYFVGNTTHKKNVFHLLPNNCIELASKSVFRFFPSTSVKIKNPHIIAYVTADILKGYLKSIYNRNKGKLKIGVTGGYDSRVLFLASLEIECKYFVMQTRFMDKNHYDITIPKRLTERFNKSFEIEIADPTKAVISQNYYNDIDFRRFVEVTEDDKKYVFVNGNVSEIARNHYGDNNLNAKDLSFMYGNSDMKFPIKQYEKWLENKKTFEKNGYHYLDMFYWEERMGNWGAKARTENNALYREVVAPFNSRGLLNMLLSTNRRLRNKNSTKLYDMIISVLSYDDKFVMNLPINPCMKKNMIRFMGKLGIYNIYRQIGIKTRKLKV
jgi:hypothetical protein